MVTHSINHTTNNNITTTTTNHNDKCDSNDKYNDNDTATTTTTTNDDNDNSNNVVDSSVRGFILREVQFTGDDESTAEPKEDPDRRRLHISLLLGIVRLSISLLIIITKGISFFLLSLLLVLLLLLCVDDLPRRSAPSLAALPISLEHMPDARFDSFALIHLKSRHRTCTR